jgi:hypothetical protein
VASAAVVMHATATPTELARPAMHSHAVLPAPVEQHTQQVVGEALAGGSPTTGEECCALLLASVQAEPATSRTPSLTHSPSRPASIK